MKYLNKDYNLKDLIERVSQLKTNNIKIGFTNGCFDL